MAEFFRIVVFDSERSLVPKCVFLGRDGAWGNFFFLPVAPVALSMGKLGSEALLYCNCVRHAVNPDVNITRRPQGEINPLD